MKCIGGKPCPYHTTVSLGRRSMVGAPFAGALRRRATRSGFYDSCSGLQSETRPQGTLERSKRDPSGDQRMATAMAGGAV